MTTGVKIYVLDEAIVIEEAIVGVGDNGAHNEYRYFSVLFIDLLDNVHINPLHRLLHILFFFI